VQKDSRADLWEIELLAGGLAASLLGATKIERDTRSQSSYSRHVAEDCNTLRCAATHCNALQRTATHCNALQRTATQCNTVEHTAVQCSTLQHTATHCNTLQHIKITPCFEKFAFSQRHEKAMEQEIVLLIQRWSSNIVSFNAGKYWIFDEQNELINSQSSLSGFGSQST